MLELSLEIHRFEVAKRVQSKMFIMSLFPSFYFFADQVCIANAEISIPVESFPQSEEILIPSLPCTLERSDHNRSNVEEEMREALDVVIATDQVLTRDIARSEFEAIWDRRMPHIRSTIGPNSFLNKSIESISKKYQNQHTATRMEDFIVKATDFFQACSSSSSIAAPDPLAIWQANLFSEISNLAGNCVVESNITSSSTHNSSAVGIYVHIDRSGLLNDTSISDTGLRESVKWKIFEELIDDPLNELNHLRLNRLLEQMHEKLLISVVHALSITDNDDVLCDQIIGCINRTTDDVNNELSFFGLKLSTDFLSTMHLNGFVLHILFDHQKREKQFNEQLEDLEQKKTSLMKYFLDQMTSYPRKNSAPH